MGRPQRNGGSRAGLETQVGVFGHVPRERGDGMAISLMPTPGSLGSGGDGSRSPPLYDGPKRQGDPVPSRTHHRFWSTRGSMAQQTHSLAVLDKFRALLAKAETLEEVTDLRSKADAVRVWAKSAAMGLEAQNRAAELKLRAERKAGELLANLKLRGGNRKSNGHDDRLNLDDLGINQSQSKRWQKEAAVSEPEFERYVKQANKFGEEVTAAGLLRLSRTATCVSSQTKRRVMRQERQVVPAGNIVQLNETKPFRADYDNQNRPAVDHAQQFELVREISDHHALLCSLLAPVCDGAVENLLPIQRQAVRRYLAETGRLLALLGAIQEQRPRRINT